MFTRNIHSEIIDFCFRGKAIIIYGMRQVGKTTLAKNILKTLNRPVAIYNGDDFDDRDLFKNPSVKKLEVLLKGNDILFIDEAQRIPNIGLIIKMIVDNIPSVQVIATGSSSLDLANIIKEPMTGRVYEYILYPFSSYEIAQNTSNIKEIGSLEQRMIYGSYPEIIIHPKEAERNIKSIANSYLFKDIFDLKDIRKHNVFPLLLKKLAFRIGKPISYSSLGNELQIDKETVNRYIDLLEKCFIIFKLNGLSNNPDKELKGAKKIFFTDLGIRNALISNFKPLSERDDVGELWENYTILERIKYNSSNRIFPNYYFWQNIYHSEIDFIEESNGNFSCFEMKWSGKKTARIPETFSTFYKTKDLKIINRDSYFNFINQLD